MQKLMSGAPEEVRRKVYQDVLVLEGKVSVVEVDLLDTREEMRKLVVATRMTRPESLRTEGRCQGTSPSTRSMSLRCTHVTSMSYCTRSTVSRKRGRCQGPIALKVKLFLRVRQYGVLKGACGRFWTAEHLKGTKVL